MTQVSPITIRGLSKGTVVIARCWRGWTVESDSDNYLSYLRVTGIAKMSAIPGNLGTIVLRHLSHGRTEFLLISFWRDWQSIEHFAGPDHDRAVFYPEDERFLVSKEHHVDHFEVAHSEFPVLPDMHRQPPKRRA